MHLIRRRVEQFHEIAFIKIVNVEIHSYSISVSQVEVDLFRTRNANDL